MALSLYAEPRHVTSTEDCFFYHTTDLPGLGEQQGEWDLRGDFAAYTDHFDFIGKRVLDIGAGSGFLSFSAEKAGAKEVVSFDMGDANQQDYLPFHNKQPYRDRAAYDEQHNRWIDQWRNAYWLSHRLLGSNAKMHYGDIYALSPELGQFDVTIVGSILEHLADPIKALKSISLVTAKTMLIVTPMIESDDRIARFEGDCMKPDVDYVFWTYSRGVYHHVLEMLNFGITSITSQTFKAHWSDERQQRHIITATRHV